jgi:hypothetical protein
VALTQVEDQKPNASGSFRRWAAYQLIGPERDERGFHPRALNACLIMCRPVNSGDMRLR